MNNLINSTFHTVAEVVQREAAKAGFQVILCITDADPAREREVLGMLAEHGADGAIVIGTGGNRRAIDDLRETGCAVVQLIRSVSGSDSPAVLADDVDGARMAVRRLIDLGHRRIGYIGGPVEADSGRERFDGYCDELRRAGVDVDEGLVRRGALVPEFGAEATRSLIDAHGPAMTALYVASHEAVFGVLPTLTARRISIPDDLSLVCHEDMNWLGLWQPPVTVVDNGAVELASVAVDLLLKQLDEPDAGAGRTFRVGARLLDRESCARVG